MSILKNAVESIQIGMEDYHSTDHRRVLSAIRNLYAGVLLLFKYKLQQLSPLGSDEALLKTKILPRADSTTGEIVWVGKGKKTVEVQDIVDRLTSLGVVGIEWKRLNSLQSIRNDIEHYFSVASIARMKEAVDDSLHLIIQFCEPHLEEHPIDVLGQECWDRMLGVSAIYDAELKACEKNLDSMTWPFDEVAEATSEMRCPGCWSSLVRVINPTAKKQKIVFICSGCQEEHMYAAVVGPAVSIVMGGLDYDYVKSGSGYDAIRCPGCGVNAFLKAHDQCASCFYELEYTNCDVCQAPLSAGDQRFVGTCADCHFGYDETMDE